MFTVVEAGLARVSDLWEMVAQVKFGVVERRNRDLASIFEVEQAQASGFIRRKGRLRRSQVAQMWD